MGVLSEARGGRSTFAQLLFCVNVSVLFIIVYLNADSIRQPEWNKRDTVNPMDLSHLRLSEGKWMSYFPHIKQMLEKIENLKEFPTWEETTSALRTTVSLAARNTYSEGEVLVVNIQAKDYNDNPKIYGGDYFRVSLNRTEVEGDGVMCGVSDHGDGTYTAKCQLLWSGSARLQVVLINPSEIIYLVIANTMRRSEPGLTMNASFINSHGVREYGVCDLDLSDRFDKTSICDYSHAKTGEPWFCAKPPSGECSPLEKQMARIVTQQAKRNIGAAYFKKCDDDCYKEVKNSGILVQMAQKSDHQNAVKDATKKLPFCNDPANTAFPTDPSAPTGFMLDGEWRPFHCESSNGRDRKFTNCLSGHSVYVMGDSTVIAWFRSLVNAFGVRSVFDGKGYWSESREVEAARFNTDLHYSSHGPPFHGEGPPASRVYIVDALDDIQDKGRPIVVMFSIGAHFGRLHPDLYLRRISLIKEAAIRTLKRLSNIRIFVLGLNYNRPWLFHVSPWVGYRHEVLLRNVFRNVDELTYLPFWDMLQKMGNEDPHPYGQYLVQRQNFFLSHVCKKDRKKLLHQLSFLSYTHVKKPS